jgi:hypothetical protein
MILNVPRRRIIIALLALFIPAVSSARPVIAFSSGSTDSSDGDPGLHKGDLAAIGERSNDAIGACRKSRGAVKRHK